MALEKELETYRQVVGNLLHQQGKYVLIQCDQVAGIFTTWQEAVDAGYLAFGLRAFLVKKIEADERPVLSFVDPTIVKRPQ
jgi:hypothetical protein